MDEEELVRRIVRALKEKELLKIGNRSYINAFRYPESRFDTKDLLFDGGSLDMLQPLRDPSKTMTDQVLILPSQLIFQLAGKTYSKSGMPEIAGQVAGGLTDAVTVINNAITSTYNAGGGIVHLKPATYVCNSRLYMNNNVELEGEGYGTILRAKDGYNTYSILIANNYGCKIRNLQLDGNKANQTSDTYGVYITGAGSYDNVIEDCYIHDFRYSGIFIQNGAYKNVIRNNRIENNGVSVSDGWCIALYNSVVDNIVTLNRLISNPARGCIMVANNGSSRNIITKNVVYDGGAVSKNGIMVTGSCRGNVVTDNVILSTYTWAGQYYFGIEIYTDSDENIVGHNTLLCQNVGTGYPAGIQVDTNSDMNIVHGNTVRGFYQGICVINTCNRNALCDNTVTGCSQFGVLISGSSCNNTLLANNIIYGNTNNIQNSGTGTIIIDNPGYNPQAASTPSVPASPATFGPYAYPMMVVVYGGTVSDITVRSLSTGLTSGTFYLYPGDTIVITYTVAPTVKLYPQ
jgi:parallel beta-helix repeat protein